MFVFEALGGIITIDGLTLIGLLCAIAAAAAIHRLCRLSHCQPLN